MKRDVRLLLFPALVIALAMSGCRSHRHAAKPAVVPQQTAKAAVPEVKVASPANDFVSPKPAEDDLGTNDPTQATEIADARGWLRDAFFDFNSSVLTSSAQ